MGRSYDHVIPQDCILCNTSFKDKSHEVLLVDAGRVVLRVKMKFVRTLYLCFKQDASKVTKFSVSDSLIVPDQILLTTSNTSMQ